MADVDDLEVNESVGDKTAVEEEKKGSNPVLPLARVKKIIKSDPEVNMVASDSCLLIARSTELFLTELVSRSWVFAQREKRKTVQYKDVANAVNMHDNLFFLSDVIPPQKTGKQITDLLRSKQKLAASSSASAAPSHRLTDDATETGEDLIGEEIDDEVIEI